MQQYLQLLKDIKEKGTLKSAARENMPGTISLFGYQFRHNLQDGFPILTTKKVSFKNIVTELLWFLNGDTNVKYLVDNGCNIWNEDAYNYYLKVCKGKLPIELLGDTLDENGDLTLLTFEEFVTILKVRSYNKLPKYNNYTLGDCGKQYGWLWRNWYNGSLNENEGRIRKNTIDQLKELINGLKNNPMSRRHIITAWNPATLDDMALNACHCFVQWNCRPIPWETKLELAKRNPNVEMENLAITEAAAGCKEFGVVPQYYLDCQLYQRSADVFLGVPYNIASYALLTEIIAKICNMVPGEMIYTYGDVHIYDDHQDVINEQLSREERELPTLKINNGFVVEWDNIWNQDLDKLVEDIKSGGWQNIFQLENYDPHPSIKAKLSTGLK